MLTTSVRLLERVRDANDQAAWSRFSALYGPLMYRWAANLGLQGADAADLVQDVFVQLLRVLPQFEYDRGGTFRGWLRTLLVNRWRDRRPAPPVLEPEEIPAAAPDPAQAVADEDDRQFLAGRALQLMQTDFQPATWKACWETVVEGRSVADVAAELEMTPAAVYIARSRVLRRLRQELAGLLD
jgi:RNA polymerase sigma-70 factor (ECF subfamily)